MEPEPGPSRSAPIVRDALGLATVYVAPQGRMETMLAELLRQVLNLDRVGVDDDFFELGGDSVAAATLFAGIEARLGREVPFSAIIKAPTVAQLAGLLASSPSGDDTAQLLQFGVGGSLPPLVLVHGATGQIFVRPPMRAALGDDLPVYGVRARGLFGRLTPHATIEAMAEEYLTLVAEIAPHGRCFIGGICIGSLIAFEMAQRLQAAGTPPLGVLLVDPYARKPPAFDETVDLQALQGSSAGRDFLEKLTQRARHMFDVEPPEDWAPADEFRLIRGAIAMQSRLDLASRSYRLRAYARPISLYCSRPQFEQIRREGSEWQSVAKGHARIWNLAPDHLALFDAYGPQLGRAMREDIDRALVEIS